MPCNLCQKLNIYEKSDKLKGISFGKLWADTGGEGGFDKERQPGDFVGQYLLLPCKGFFSKADTRLMIARAGSKPIEKTFEKTRGLSGKIVGYTVPDKVGYKQHVMHLEFKDGGPFDYFIEASRALLYFTHIMLMARYMAGYMAGYMWRVTWRVTWRKTFHVCLLAICRRRPSQTRPPRACS